MTLFASALPVPMPRGMLVSVSIAPILASAYLGGPAAGAFVALVGSTEMREHAAAFLGTGRSQITRV